VAGGLRGLVAVDRERIIGFVCASIDAGSGLLPGLLGEIDALYVTPAARDQGVSGRLAQNMIEQLCEQGAGTIRSLMCIENPEAQAFWQAQGFERYMVCMSLYRNG
jgi:ribosomal protein S18 acetylase RimI-like enzyme